MNKHDWIVVAVAHGDGSVDYGRRVWSERFKSKQAAMEVHEFLADCKEISSLVIKDN